MEKIFRPTSRLVVLKDKKILLCKMWNCWGLPGGGLDWGESIQTALNRESIEELWIPAVFDKVVFMQDFLVKFHDKQTDNHALEYFCTVKNNSDYFDAVDTYHNSSHAHELKDLNWFWLDEIPADMKPQEFLAVLKQYLENPENTQGVYNSWIN